ncbi:hypothetical protein VFPFJ_10556 [Purpureocillium lilacinum]|uniref:Uncharacterized protein n=1 Tax=Purpureocillium lilacinum TaxID=33203 RepID=A0A179GFZ8_PURLI|nr:hypothetical protein VFPFJ_10556 [Purpureocillium lilacinum]OAQ76774.1 hypothetical protein VFPFJ_10556 [Purpureocillium lilacinum]
MDGWRSRPVVERAGGRMDRCRDRLSDGACSSSGSGRGCAKRSSVIVELGELLDCRPRPGGREREEPPATARSGRLQLSDGRRHLGSTKFR